MMAGPTPVVCAKAFEAATAATSTAVLDSTLIRIVLVEPQHPGNVGASARAMKISVPGRGAIH